MESAAGFAAYQQGDFEVNWQGTGLNFLDPDAANDLLWLPTAGRNYQGWENADFIALFNEEKQEVDQGKRGETAAPDDRHSAGRCAVHTRHAGASASTCNTAA